MKAAFLSRPLAWANVCLTWDVGQVLNLLRSWGLIYSLSFPQLSWRSFALTLIFSCHCISNISLLGVDEPFLSLREESAVLQVGFRLKQVHPGHVSPLIHFLKAPDVALCPVSHLKAYVAASAEIQSSHCLFVTMVPSHGAAAKATLKRWFAKVL